MEINQLYLTSYLKNVVKFYLNYAIALEVSMKLKDMLMKLKAIPEVILW